MELIIRGADVMRTYFAKLQRSKISSSCAVLLEDTLKSGCNELPCALEITPSKKNRKSWITTEVYMHKPECNSLSSSTAVSKPSSFPNSSKPTSLGVWISRVSTTPVWCVLAYLSFVTPSTKHITHGRTLIANFSTSQGVFSTKTRMNRVL